MSISFNILKVRYCNVSQHYVTGLIHLEQSPLNSVLPCLWAVLCLLPQLLWHQGLVLWKTIFPWRSAGNVSGGNASNGERWGAADEALLTSLPLTSCCAACFLTGHRPVVGVADPCSRTQFLPSCSHTISNPTPPSGCEYIPKRYPGCPHPPH